MNDINKLQTWLEEHKDDGHYQGRPIIEDRSIELSGFVHERDYNDALKLAAPWALKKSFIAQHGVLCVASRGNTLLQSQIVNLPTYSKGQAIARLFRGRVTEGIIEILKLELADYQLNASQTATVVLRYFIACPTVNRVYQDWIRLWMQRTGLDQSSVEDIIYNYYRVDGCKKRLSALHNNPEDAQDKMY